MAEIDQTILVITIDDGDDDDGNSVKIEDKHLKDNEGDNDDVIFVCDTSEFNESPNEAEGNSMRISQRSLSGMHKGDPIARKVMKFGERNPSENSKIELDSKSKTIKKRKKKTLFNVGVNNEVKHDSKGKKNRKRKRKKNSNQSVKVQDMNKTGNSSKTLKANQSSICDNKKSRNLQTLISEAKMKSKSLIGKSRWGDTKLVKKTNSQTNVAVDKAAVKNQNSDGFPATEIKSRPKSNSLPNGKLVRETNSHSKVTLDKANKNQSSNGCSAIEIKKSCSTFGSESQKIQTRATFPSPVKTNAPVLARVPNSQSSVTFPSSFGQNRGQYPTAARINFYSSQNTNNCSACDYNSNVYSILPKPLRPIVIDASNVAYSHGRSTAFSCKGILICVDYFIRRGHMVKAFVPHYRLYGGYDTLDREILYKLDRDNILVVTPSRKVDGRLIVSYDDRFILEYASCSGGIVVSNDNYQDLIHEPQFTNVIKYRKLMFTFVDDFFMVPNDPFGRNGPTLDQYLRF